MAKQRKKIWGTGELEVLQRVYPHAEGDTDQAVEAVRSALADSGFPTPTAAQVRAAIGNYHVNRQRPARRRRFSTSPGERIMADAAEESLAAIVHGLGEAIRRSVEGLQSECRQLERWSAEIRRRIQASLVDGRRAPSDRLARLAELVGELRHPRDAGDSRSVYEDE